MMIVPFVRISLVAQVFQKHSNNLEFIENKNQWEKNILYKADLNNGAVFLEKDCFTFAFKDAVALNKILESNHVHSDNGGQLAPTDYIIKCHAYKIKFLNALPDVITSTNKPFEGYYNYFIGNDKNKWASNVKSYNNVEYAGLYEKTDLNVYESNSRFKYDFILHPGANTDNIKLFYDGADKVSIKDNNLVVKTSVNEITELSPESYQIIDGKRKNVSCKYRLKDNVLSFDFPDGYDKTNDLIIDPTLVFSTYSGSTIDNWGFTATYDTSGCAYSGGIAFGTGYPVTTGAYQINFAGGNLGGYLSGCDIAIIKYNPIGTQRLWATYLGGTKNEIPQSMIVNTLNELIIYGTTGSSDFPVTTGSFDQNFKGGTSVGYDQNSLIFSQGIDIFVSKFSSDGTQLQSSTFVGGTGNDGLNYPSLLSFNYADGARGEIMTDKSNNVYVASTTHSTDFPVTSGAFQTISGGGGQDGVVFKLSPDLSTMIWGSYLGGSAADAVYGIVLDTNDNVYVTGGTSSTNFPTTAGALHTTYQGGSSDGFITEISSDGSNIMKSTYYGSDTCDQTYLIDRGTTGKIYVFGQTSKAGNTFITNATWATPGGGQFVSKLEPDLSTVIWSTAFGTGNGGPDISPAAFGVDNCGYIYMSGWGGTGLNGFGGTTGLPITSNAFQSTTDGNDFYFLVLNDNPSSLIYGTYFGSPNAYEHIDGGTSRYDKKGVLYQGVCAGCGGWSNFPTTPGAWSNTNNSTNCNNALVKFDFQLTGVAVTANVTPIDTGCAPLTANFTSSGNAVDFLWNFDDLSSGINNNSILQNPSHIFNSPGTYHVILIGVDSTKCNISDTAFLTITVNPLPPVPTITQNGHALMSSSSTGNQWYLNGNPLTGATSQFYITTQNGFYQVEVANNFGCKSISAILSVTNAKIEEYSYDNEIFIYPNPANDNITIEVPQKATIEISNIQGQLIKIIPTSGNKTNVDVSAFTSGIYIVEVKTEIGIAVKKFVKE